MQPGTKTGVPVLTDNPKEVGADRIVNSLAAHHLFGGPSIVVDFGTATNFDAVSERGEFLGGSSRPASRSPSTRSACAGAQLLKIELARPRSVIGKNTVEAMQSGIIYGFAGQVDGVVRSRSSPRPTRSTSRSSPPAAWPRGPPESERSPNTSRT